MTQIADRRTDSVTDLVHEKSVEILNEVGFCVPDPVALDRLERAGFRVDRDSQMVRVTTDLLTTAIAGLNRDVNLYDRAGTQATPYRQRSCFMGAGTPVHVFDLDSGKHRPATRQDVRQLVALQDSLPQIDIVRPTVTAADQGDCSDLVEIVELLRNTVKPIVHRTLSPDRVDAAFAMLAAVAGGEEEFRTHPNFATLYCPISPSYFTPENINCMFRWAEKGVPVTLLSMAMGGASAPATLLGELVVINTEILAWIVALQTLYPGTPLIYGSVSAVLDMRTGLLPLGAPERGMINSGAALMAQYYGLPSMCGGLSSDAKELDAQAGFEKSVTAFPLLKEKASIIYGAGAVDAGNTISYLQMVMDDEIIAGLRRMMEGIEMHDLDEEVALIKANTPRGNFLKAKHTRRTFREHWLPGILSRDNYDTWLAKGKSIEQICQQRARQLIDEYIPPALPAAVEAELEYIMCHHIPDFRIESW